jgi:[acyl-carrier-protein] S-malonyltransferase
MAAVVGAPAGSVEAACAEARALGVCDVANFNSSDQVVISGAVAAVQDAMRRLEARGAKLVKQLNVSGAFHSALMREPAAALASALEATHFADAAVPVVPNVTAVPEQRGEILRTLLARQIHSPVRWDDSMRALRTVFDGAVLEVGSGNVLKGLLRRIDRQADCQSIGDRASLEALGAKTSTP